MTALLVEAIIMLIAMIVAAGWVTLRFDVPQTLGSTIPVGLVALAILAPAEIAGVLWVRGQSLQDYTASFVTAPGVISVVMFVLFAVMPTLVTLVRRGHVGASADSPRKLAAAARWVRESPAITALRRFKIARHSA